MTTLDITPEVRDNPAASSTPCMAGPGPAVAGAAPASRSALRIGTVVAPQEYEHVRDTISVLASVDNPHAWIVQAGFLAMAVGLGAAAVGLWQARYLSARVAAGLVAVSAVAMVVAGLNQIACNPALAECEAFLDADAPRATVIHGRAALFVFVPLLLAGLAVARAAWAARRPAGLRSCSGWLGSTSPWSSSPRTASARSGLFQRLFALGSMGLPVLAVSLLTGRRA